MVGRKCLLLVISCFIMIICLSYLPASGEVSPQDYSFSIAGYQESTVFTIPNDSTENTVRVNWSCLTFETTYAGAYLKITDSDGKVVALYEPETDGTGENNTISGYFLGERGKRYTVEIYGGLMKKIEGHIKATITYTIKHNYILYYMDFMKIDDSKGKGRNNTFNLFLPANSPLPGSYYYKPLGGDKSLNINNASNLKLSNYPIKVYYQLYKKGGDDKKNDPHFHIYKYLPNGSKTLLVSHPIKYEGEALYSDSFVLGPNEGMFIQLFTGARGDGKADGYECWYKIYYQFDQEPPEKPVFQLKTDTNAKLINGVIHTNQNLVTFEWETPKDRGTEFNGFVYGPGGTSEYYLVYNDQNIGWFTGNQKGLPLSEGEYNIKLKARDLDKNESGFSEPIKIRVDRSVDQVTLPENPVTLNENKATLKWNKIGDISGIKEYHVALTTGITPENEIITIDPSAVPQYTFDTPLSSKYTYTLWVRAVDDLGNLGPWTQTDISLPPESSRFVEIKPQAEVIDGKPSYKVDLSLQPVSAAAFVIERETVGGSAADKVVKELTYEELEEISFTYSDQTNLTKHGKYRYTVYTKNQTGQSSEKIISDIVTIPNIFTTITVDGPGPQLVTNNRTHRFDLISKTDIEGDDVKFRVWYQQGSTVYRSSESFQSEPVMINFANGEWDWWIETVEYSAGVLVENSSQLSEKSRLVIETDTKLPINLPGIIETTPGKPVNLKVTIQDLNIQPIEYHWDPGDGSPGLTGETPVYAYTKLGDYLLTVTVKDSNSILYIITTTVRVSNTTMGQLYMDETWSGTHRIYGDVTVPENIRLTIEPGTEIIIDGIPGDTDYHHALIINGKLDIKGETQNVTIHSVTNKPDGWQGIIIDGEAEIAGVVLTDAQRGLAILDNAVVTINKSLLKGNQVGIHVYNAKPTIKNTVFQENVLYGIKEDENGQPMVDSCRFIDNGMNYYNQELTEITIDELNAISGNSGNQDQ